MSNRKPFKVLIIYISSDDCIIDRRFNIGYYGGVLVNMKRNLFDHFEEPVFRNVLVDMYCHRSGQLDLEFSKNLCLYRRHRILRLRTVN